MANTSLLRRDVEGYVRHVLAERYHQPFSARRLKLLPGGTHEFDAVSVDGQIVVSIKSASGLTAGGRNPSGKIKDCVAELYYLSLIEAPVRKLVLTTPSFYDLFTRQISGALAEGLSIECCPLPNQLQIQVDEVVKRASREVSPVQVVADRAEDVASQIS